MKVVLKQDVKTIGKKDELHEVSAGYARNYLFPRGLAAPADAAAINEVKTKASAAQHHQKEVTDAAQAIAQKLNGINITLKARAGQGGRLFGSVTVKDIAEELAKLGITIDKRKLSIEGREIKAFGSYPVEAKLYPGVSARFTCTVEE